MCAADDGGPCHGFARTDSVRLQTSFAPFSIVLCISQMSYDFVHDVPASSSCPVRRVAFLAPLCPRVELVPSSNARVNGCEGDGAATG